MIKLTYENGKIRTGFETFHCDSKEDMEKLCNKINSILLEDRINMDRMKIQLDLIKKALTLNGDSE